MKKVLVISVSALLLLSSCGTYTGSGAYAGGSFGSIIGSAIGGIAGGPRGSDIGTLVGMAGGAVVGAAVGSAADKAEQRKYEEYREAREQARQRTPSRTVTPRNYDYGSDNYGSYNESGSGDDRLYGYGENFGGSSYAETNTPANLEIRNARLLDASRDGVLTRGEEARVVFEIFNRSSKTAYRVQPSVYEVTGNRHIHISENILIESIPAGKGVRYTANVKADSYLRDGEAVIRVGVLQGNRDLPSQSKDFRIQTSKR